MSNPNDFGFYLKRLSSQNAESLSHPEAGASGYFSEPAHELDPHLFDGERIRDNVRTFVNSKLINWFNNETGLKGARNWLHVWIAGSGVTYQWQASRGNGDLDVLFGVDWVKFRQMNDDETGNSVMAIDSEDEMADIVNTELKASLWPETAEQNLNGQIYEVTFYWNPGTGTNIKNIHPYAAYDLTTNTWSVRPPKLAQDPATLYPQDWKAEAGQDLTQANALLDRYNKSLNSLNASTEGSPGWHNATSELRLIADQAKVLFDDIHLGRKAAFQEGGKGYGDWTNFRWQSAKNSGAIQKLHTLASIDVEAKHAQEENTYGAQIKNARQALTEAMMANRGRNG